MTDSPVNTENPPIVEQNKPRPLVAACRTCPFFHSPSEPEEGKLIAGECRLDAPGVDSRGVALWPRVHEGLWCGSHPLMQSFVTTTMGERLPENGYIMRGLRPLPAPVDEDKVKKENPDA